MNRMKWLLILVTFMIMFSTNVTSTEAMSLSKGNHVIQTAKHYLGTPYYFGAPYGTTRAFDCSSFTKYVFAKNGLHLPRVSREQARVGRYVSKSHLRVGDLVFFSTPHNRRISHVGIYMGHGKFIHTFAQPYGVTISSLNSGWWRTHYITARRVG